MFYSQFILAKKGPLGTIWIAAHLERKLRKNQVADTDIGVSVDSILFPDVPIALRLSSHLLLGVVRIYSRKVNYLFDDCSEALLKVKQAFRSTAVDLPPEESTAPYHSITLPETFDLDDFELPDNDISLGNYVDHHVSTRDQITLQDNMEGVVYTTSQFGLDERFGDGDASQIGFDLDEVLLGDKAAAMDHDGLSANPEDDNNEELRATLDRMQVEDSGSKTDLIYGQPTLTEASEYAQGPSTPGLQEPNLFGTQVDQVNDEADCNNSADLVSMKTEQKESSAHQMENDVVDCSEQNYGKHVGVDLHHGDSACIVVEVDSKREEEEHLASTVVTKDQENFIPDDHCLTLEPLVDSSNKDHPTTISPESAGGMIDSSNMPEKVEDLHDRVLVNDEPIVVPLGHHVNVVPEGVSVNETFASPSYSHATSEQENLPFKMLANVDGSRGPESDGHLEDNNTLSKHEVLNDTEISRSEGQPCPVEEAQVSNIINHLGSPGRPEVVDVEAQASQELKEVENSNHVSLEVEEPTESYLRPCTYHQRQPSLSPMEGEKCHETDVSDPALGHHETAEPSVHKEKPDLGESVMLFGSQILSNKMESIGKSAASDMPEPEKMLSLAYQRDGEANDLLLESTPVNQGTSEGHTDATGVKYISGRKRSFAESTLTMQSVDLVESYGGAQSKRTRESVPDDDDLLSSILAGRGSSVFKIKPSPAAPEIASTKHFRSGTRTSAIKRKVLMDDIMVLHGDTIRQQLTSTEDIRRLRKKAPCTRHEILMIQRQFLEDEIFHEPIFTDLSANLTILRKDAFDLTGIKVCDSGLDSSSIEKINDQESYSRTNTEIHGVELEVNNEPMAVQHQENTAAQPTEISILSKSHQSEVNMAYHDIDAQEHPNIISQVKDLDSSQNAEMNNAGGNIEVSEAEKCSVAPGIESSALTDLFENDLCMPNDFVATLPLMDETNDLVDSIHTHALSEPTAQNMNAFPNQEDEFVEDHRDRSEVGAVNIAEPAMEIRTQVLTNGVEANDLCPSLAPGSVEIAEQAMEIRTQVLTDGVEANDLCPSLAPGSVEIAEQAMESRTEVLMDGVEANDLCPSSAPGCKETDEHADNQASFNGDLPVEESGNFMLGGVNEDQIVSSGLGCDDKDTKSDFIFSENTKVDCLHSVALDLDENKSSLNDEENLVCQEAALQSTMLPEVPAIQSPFVDQKDEDDMVANDTGFLNVGDDEIIEDDDNDDFMPSAEGSHLENSGWSSRTRAVAKYLQTSFVKEDLHGRQNLQLDNILAGKTRKEASRMFFETLVLKTRDYIHVEQAKPFDNITLKPRAKLMKADF